MSKKFKAMLVAPRISRWNRKARKHGKKYVKFPEDQKYSMEWRNTFVLKRVKKALAAIDVVVEVKGYENLPKAPAILAPNHTSQFDPGLILMALENPSESPEAIDGHPLFLAKSDVKKDKRGKGYAALLDTFYIDRKKPREAIKQIDDMAIFAKENKRYQVIFPEGTRSVDGKIGTFKSGAFRSAKKAFAPIVPVTINNALSITNLDRQGKLKVEVIFHKPIKPMSFMTQDTKAIAANVQRVVESAWVKPEGSRAKRESKS